MAQETKEETTKVREKKREAGRPNERLAGTRGGERRDVHAEKALQPPPKEEEKAKREKGEHVMVARAEKICKVEANEEKRRKPETSTLATNRHVLLAM
jgi:hypothetical protein